jgi:hypothetical protein
MPRHRLTPEDYELIRTWYPQIGTAVIEKLSVPIKPGYLYVLTSKMGLKRADKSALGDNVEQGDALKTSPAELLNLLRETAVVLGGLLAESRRLLDGQQKTALEIERYAFKSANLAEELARADRR